MTEEGRRRVLRANALLAELGNPDILDALEELGRRRAACPSESAPHDAQAGLTASGAAQAAPVVALTLTVDQAAALVRLLDLATRMHMIQFDELAYFARTGEFRHHDGRELTGDELHGVEDALRVLKAQFGFAMNASWGIGSRHVGIDAHRGYEIKKVVDKALAEWREPHPDGFRGVNYDGLVVRYTADPAPVATITHKERP